MPTLEVLGNKIDNAKDLHSVVKIMKSVSAVSIRQFEQAVESLNIYSQTIEKGLRIMLQFQTGSHPWLRGEKIKKWGSVVFGAQQGMCGQFNEVIVEYTRNQLLDLLPDINQAHIIGMGPRIQGFLEQNELPVEDIMPLPSSVQHIVKSVQELLLRLEKWISRSNVEGIILFYNEKQSGSAFKPGKLNLLPLDPVWIQSLRKQTWDSRTLPEFTMDWQKLFSRLIRQWFFISLYRAFAESLASENASRLASMQAAEQNIQDYLADLRHKYNQQRQTEVTSELLDIISGYEALSQSK